MAWLPQPQETLGSRPKQVASSTGVQSSSINQTPPPLPWSPPAPRLPATGVVQVAGPSGYSGSAESLTEGGRDTTTSNTANSSIQHNSEAMPGQVVQNAVLNVTRPLSPEAADEKAEVGSSSSNGAASQQTVSTSDAAGSSLLPRPELPVLLPLQQLGAGGKPTIENSILVQSSSLLATLLVQALG